MDLNLPECATHGKIPPSEFSATETNMSQTEFRRLAICERRVPNPLFYAFILGKFGGAEEDRTPDLRIANATLSQLSYGPK